MPGTLPTARDVHADRYLSGYSVGYGQDLKNDYVADRACTVVPVKNQSDSFVIWDKADQYRDEMGLWADGAPTPEGGFRKSDGTYMCKRYGIKSLITDPQRDNADGEIDLEAAKVKWLTGQTKLRRDKIFQSVAFKTGVWTANTEQTGVAAAPAANQFLQFNDGASIPLEVVHKQKLVVQLSTGLMPNVIVTDPDTDMWLKLHSTIKDIYKHTQPGVITDDLLAQAFGVEEYIVAKAVENTANEGATATMARPFGKGMLIMHRAKTPSDDDPTALSLFSWSKHDFVTPEGAAIDTWRDEDRSGDWYRASQFVDIKISANDLGVFLLNTVA